MKTNYDICKYCKLFRDWLLSVNDLSLRDIENQLIIMGFSSCSNLASSYAYFLSEYQEHKSNPNFERVLICLQRMIIREFLAIYDFYPSFDSSGIFAYSSCRAKDLNNK